MNVHISGILVLFELEVTTSFCIPLLDKREQTYVQSPVFSYVFLLCLQEANHLYKRKVRDTKLLYFISFNSAIRAKKSKLTPLEPLTSRSILKILWGMNGLNPPAKYTPEAL